MDHILAEFHQLTLKQLHDLMLLRQQVFIIEQNCLYEDIDGADEKAEHLLIYKNSELAGYLRIFEPGIKYEEACIGRIVVKPNHRGSTIGKYLIEKGIEYASMKFPEHNIRIEAQAALKEYYEAYGFKAEGDVYQLDGIDHIEMVLLNSN